MSIALPDPESPHDHSFNHTNEAPLKPPTCYFGVYPHGMAKEGTVIKILSWEHLDNMLEKSERTTASPAA